MSGRTSRRRRSVDFDLDANLRQFDADINLRGADADLNLRGLDANGRVRLSRRSGAEAPVNLRQRRAWFSNDTDTPERFYRAMSETEYRRVTEARGLVLRKKGSRYLGVTQNRNYVESLTSRPRIAKNYPAVLEFEVQSGTAARLEALGAVHPSAIERFPNHPLFTSGTNAVQLKFERGGVLSYGLGSSQEGLTIFNDAILNITRIR
jgi:hypothetical protein